MASRGIEADIDRLYQLPLDEFTPARNALAKTAGKDAARVRALSKPPIAAWAINQLYWQNGDLWNALVAAAENAQRAHRAVLAGKAADVRAASKVHEDAVDKALRATLALLAQAKHPATDATKHAIGTTLRAVPGDEPPGRFTRTLQPAGFGMLTGLPIAPGPGPKRQKAAPAPRTKSAGAERPEPRVDAKTLTRARQAAAMAADALRTAEAAVRREEFERARAEREEKRAETAVEKARDERDRANAELATAEAARKEAARLREAAVKRAAAAEAALPKARKEAAAAAAELQALEKGR
jgi:hypothetical protein